MKKNNVRNEEPLHEITKGYKEYPPPPELAPFLQCYWSYYTESSVVQPVRKPVIPDGCIDIIFDLDDRAPQRNFVVGAMTRPFYSDKTNLVGIRFKPGAAYAFFGLPLNRLTDLLVDFNEFVGQEASDISDQLAAFHSTQNRIDFLNRTFYKKLRSLPPLEPQMLKALDIIQITGGCASVRQISETVGWSRQHLTRKCLACSGLTPKFLSQVTRLTSAIRWYQSEICCSMSQLSVDAGYYDQAHMINEFKTITGLTPTEYLA